MQKLTGKDPKVYVKPDTVNRLRQYCTANGIIMSFAATEAIEQWLASKEQTVSTKIAS